MFIKTIKLKKPKAAVAGIIVIVLAIIAVIFAVTGSLSNKREPEMTNESQRQEFMSSLGWKVSESYEQCKVIVIPENFNEVYTNYNKLQKEQGFNLEKYKGKTVENYTYTVYNYKGYEDKECIKCNLLICDGKLIGGDVCSTEVGGFMQGLKR